MHISKTTFFISAFIVISASFTRQLMDFVKINIGENVFLALIWLALIVSGLAFSIFISKNKIMLFKKILFILMLITVLLTIIWRIKIPEERIHIVEFAILGWFAGRDLTKNSKCKGLILASVFSIIIGVLDETFQGILPYRYFQLKDIIFNSLGGICGAGFYFLK